MPTSGDQNSGDRVLCITTPPPPHPLNPQKYQRQKDQIIKDYVEQTCQPPKDKKCEILNLELGKVVRNW